MSCNYADGLSPYLDKGVLGVPEVIFSKFISKYFPMAVRPLICVIYCFCRVCKLCFFTLQKFDDEEVVNEKCNSVAEMIKSSKHVVIHTGAGISTCKFNLKYNF